MSKTHLVIGDCHVKDGQDFSHLMALGEYIVDLRPDVIVQLGDFADMESLSSYDKGKKDFEGRRYKKDCSASKVALATLFGPMFRLQEQQRRNKKKIYDPRKIITVGNHEARIDRAIQLDPILEDTLDIGRDLGYNSFFDEVIPYLEPCLVDGIAYCHLFTSGAMGKAIGGVNHARQLLQSRMMSCTCGHSHLYDASMTTTGDGRRIQGAVAGCYFDHFEKYASQSNMSWWRGVLVKRNVWYGQYDLSMISMESITHTYLPDKE